MPFSTGMHNLLRKIDSSLEIIGGLLLLSGLTFIGYTIYIIAR